MLLGNFFLILYLTVYTDAGSTLKRWAMCLTSSPLRKQRIYFWSTTVSGFVAWAKSLWASSMSIPLMPSWSARRRSEEWRALFSNSAARASS